MTSTLRSAAASHGAAHAPESRKPMLLRLIDAVAGWDARYRQAQKLREMPDERLADMGLTRRDALTAFRRGR